MIFSIKTYIYEYPVMARRYSLYTMMMVTFKNYKRIKKNRILPPKKIQPPHILIIDLLIKL